MTEVAAGRNRLAEATPRRAMRRPRIGDDLQVTRFGSTQGQVVAIGHDGGGEPRVVLADSRGRRITLGLACHRDVTLRTRHGVDGFPDIFCRATDVAP